MNLLKGAVTIAGTLIALGVATIIFLSAQVTRLPGFQGQVGLALDVRVLKALLLYSPLYWALVLVLLTMSVSVFRRWVLH